ncbi:MAG: hypothetical protein E7320_01745 [Clostridiales bacterium]|nr:hypothetical protein [Clostridiales bacterium]
MRNVQITRKKSFVGIALSYTIVVAYPKADAPATEDVWSYEDAGMTSITNGQTITLPIQDGKCGIFVEVPKTFGFKREAAFLIDEGTADVELELITKFHWTRGAAFLLRPAAAEQPGA